MAVKITSFNSTLFEYLCGFVWFDTDRLTEMMKRYFIGATEPTEDSRGQTVGQPIFWHINAEHTTTNGHIITMDGNTGKVYDDGWYYQDHRPMCLFGEHLLQTFPTQTLALVKDEMTASIMSTFPTPYVWLATGKQSIDAADLIPLVGRTVVAFPDKGDYNLWKESLGAVPNLQFHVSDVMEKSQGDCHTIAQIVLSQQPLRLSEAEVVLIRLEDANPNIKLLVEALDLEVVGILPTNEKAKYETSKPEPVSERTQEVSFVKSIASEQEKRWHGRNKECHQCKLSHEGVNGTYCNKLRRYVEYGKGDCGR